MKIENLERAAAINRQLEKLRMIEMLLSEQHSMIVVYKTTSKDSQNECTWDDELRAVLKRAVRKIISDCEKEVEKL